MRKAKILLLGWTTILLVVASACLGFAWLGAFMMHNAHAPWLFLGFAISMLTLWLLASWSVTAGYAAKFDAVLEGKDNG